jgi:UDP-N-acetylglucosamine 2-epimerase (non-hydrolysing)
MKIITILGTRPEIIKLSPLIPLLDDHYKHILIHTGQHYSWEMDKMFFDELKVRNPDYNLNVGSSSHGDQTGRMLRELEEIMFQEKPDLIVTLGDTNTTMAAALSARKMKIKLLHIESGCRSNNKNQPEEINRIVADHCSDILTVMEMESYNNLMKEGFTEKEVFLVGNIGQDACIRALEIDNNVLQELNIEKNKYVLVTVHRAENTDNVQNLKNIITALNKMAEKIDVIFPAHPRTKKVIDQEQILISDKLKLIPPIGYVNFTNLMANARFIITDSGGVQEEAVFLNVPTLIPRDNVELKEFVEAGKNILVGANTEKILESANLLIDSDEEIEKIKNAPLHLEQNPCARIFEIIKKRWN